MTLLLWVLYPLAIQYERGGWWRCVLPVTLLALIVDVIANWTELALLSQQARRMGLWDWPRLGEWTFSTRLKRLRYNDDWRGDVGRYIARVLDAIAPSGKHI